MAELAAALEIGSEHPLADAIVKFAAETLGHSLELPSASNVTPSKHDGSVGARKVDWVRPAKDLTMVAGKGIVGWAASSGSGTSLGSGLPAAAGPETPTKRSPIKASPAKGPSPSKGPSPAKGGPASSRDVKVVLGNKQMMADENIPISKAVDDYMRDMEVRGSQPQLQTGFKERNDIVSVADCRCWLHGSLCMCIKGGHLSGCQGAAVGK